MREDKFQRRAALQANRSAWITIATLHFSHEREKDYSKTKPQSWFGRCGKHRLAKTLFPVQSSWTLNTSLQQPSTKTKWGHRHRHRRHNDNSHSRHLSEFEPEHAVCMWPDRSPRGEIAKKNAQNNRTAPFRMTASEPLTEKSTCRFGSPKHPRKKQLDCAGTDQKNGLFCAKLKKK